MKKDLLDNIEQRLARLIEEPFKALFPSERADQLLAKKLVSAMSENLGVDASGRVTAPVYYEIRLNPLHTPLWGDPPGLSTVLHEALLKVAREQGISFERPPVIMAIFDSIVDPQDIQVVSMEIDEVPQATSEVPPDAPETAIVPGDAFLIINGGRHMPLSEPVITIGRDPGNQLVLDKPQVSRLHAQLRAIEWSYHLFDLDSTCGTLVNGKPIGHCVLQTGDVIDIGGVTLVYGQESGGTDDTTAMPASPPAGKSGS